MAFQNLGAVVITGESNENAAEETTEGNYFFRLIQCRSTLQGDKSGLGLGWVDFVLVVPPSAQNLGCQWNNQNLVNQTQSQTGCVTLYIQTVL